MIRRLINADKTDVTTDLEQPHASVTKAAPEDATNLPRPSIAEAEDIDAITFAQPDEEVIDGVAERHRDDKLQTNLVSENLQKRLLRLYYDARTF